MVNKDDAINLQRNIIQLKCVVDEECPICLTNMLDSKVKYLKCGHCFHIKCVKTLASSRFPSRHKCPVCRTPYTDDRQREERVGILRIIDEMTGILVFPNEERMQWVTISDPA